MAIILLQFLILAICFLSACSTIPLSLLNLDKSHSQAVLVESKGTKAIVSLWQKNGHWEKVIQSPAVIGRKGLAGAGLKKEGDGKTPQGMFEVKRAFGYDHTLATGIDYKQVNANDLWVDDVDSVDYNQWVSSTKAKSFEKLRRNDNLYRIGVVIEYNTNPIIKGAGSAIFMHIWRSYYKPTAGCVALPMRHLRKIVSKLNNDHKPVIIIGDAHGS